MAKNAAVSGLRSKSPGRVPRDAAGTGPGRGAGTVAGARAVGGDVVVRTGTAVAASGRDGRRRGASRAGGDGTGERGASRGGGVRSARSRGSIARAEFGCGAGGGVARGGPPEGGPRSDPRASSSRPGAEEDAADEGSSGDPGEGSRSHTRSVASGVTASASGEARSSSANRGVCEGGGPGDERARSVSVRRERRRG